MEFPTNIADIWARVNSIDPSAYGETRNYINGSVTYLSPYISRGVISTQQIYRSILEREIPFEEYEKLLQELAWRDYWQLIWDKLGHEINEDIRQVQTDVLNFGVSNNLELGNTGIAAIDTSIADWYESGYLHNHSRMYIASIACNIGKSHWKRPAKWMYYHLLDGDWASNALSWQWVAGTNSNKKYFANQENINRFNNSKQEQTFLSVDYDQFPLDFTPEILKETNVEFLEPYLPQNNENLIINKEQPACIYNYYNLDPLWKSSISANRILLLEPSVFNAYPVSQKCMEFAISLSSNIKDIQLFVGEFDELKALLGNGDVYYKQHPLNSKYEGFEMSRDFIFKEKEHLNSFFSFWKRCKKELKFD